MGSWQGKTFISTPCSFPDSLTLFSRSSTPPGQQDLTDHPACWGTLITVTHSGCWGPARLAWAAQPEDRGTSLGSTSPPGPRCALVSFLLGCQGLQAGRWEREAAPHSRELAALVWPGAMTTAIPSSLPLAAAAARPGLYRAGGKRRES